MSKRSILVVDDDQSVRSYLSDFLGSCGYSVECAESGDQAVARLSAFCLAWRHCEGAVGGDDESLVRALDDVTDPRVTDRIVLWLGCHPSVDTVYDA